VGEELMEYTPEITDKLVLQRQDSTGTDNFEYSGTVCLYCANSTAYRGKAKALFGSKLIDEANGEKAIVACLQEIHLTENECNKEAELL
jgi:hypothetical protein